MTIKNDPQETLPEGLPLQSLLLILLSVAAGVLLAINLMPLWLPGLALSAAGSEPKIFWFLSRGSAIAAYWILWLAMGMGIVITNRLARVWPGAVPAFEIHQFTSMLGVGLALFHALILLGDRYMNYTLGQVLLPFTSTGYEPLWVGVGQSAFYGWLLIVLSFYVRKRIGKNAWRLIHFGSYACFLAVMLHGIFSGTDTAARWVQILYWVSGASLLFLTVYRVLNSRLAAAPRKPVPSAGD